MGITKIPLPARYENYQDPITSYTWELLRYPYDPDMGITKIHYQLDRLLRSYYQLDMRITNISLPARYVEITKIPLPARHGNYYDMRITS